MELLGIESIADAAGQDAVSVELSPSTEQLDGYTRGTDEFGPSRTCG